MLVISLSSAGAKWSGTIQERCRSKRSRTTPVRNDSAFRLLGPICSSIRVTVVPPMLQVCILCSLGCDGHRLLEAGHGEAELVELGNHVAAGLLVGLDQRR